MKKRSLLLVMVMFITFLGGFLSGVFYSTEKNPQDQLNNSEATDSIKKPQHKQDLNKLAHQTKVVMGYVQDYRDPHSVDYENLTHVIFSFAHPNKDGKIIFNGDNALQNLRLTVSNGKKYNTKVILAVGGWYHINGGESYPYFKEAISNPTSRNMLVDELNNIAIREKLDGIDIDFEHPRNKEDAKNLLQFIQQLNEKLEDSNKELSIAVNAKVHSVAGTEINNVVFLPETFQYVDHVNIMAYDGQWDGGYNAANLSPYPYAENIVKYWTSLFDNYQLSREKLVLGVPFYAQPVNPKSKQISYETIVKNNPNNANKDIVNINGNTYYYNGKNTIERKTNLALDQGLGGMMLWEAGHDAKGTLSLTKTIANTIQQRNLVSKK